VSNAPQENTTEPAPSQKNKSPAFQFYPKDFLTDDKVMEMSAELRGLYITLLCVDWLNDGFFAKSLLRLSGFDWHTDGLAIRDDYEDIECQLMGCFEPHPTKPGYVTNPRLQRERIAQQEHKNERIASGKKGAAKRWAEASDSQWLADGSAINQPLAKNGSSSSPSTSTSSPNKEIHTPPKPKPDFLEQIILPPSLDNDTGKDALKDWLDYKRERRETYKSAKGILALLTHYAPLGAGRFRAAVNHSMSQNYAGCFEPKGSAPNSFRNGKQSLSEKLDLINQG
jgi:hypothetical protein